MADNQKSVLEIVAVEGGASASRKLTEKEFKDFDPKQAQEEFKKAQALAADFRDSVNELKNVPGFNLDSLKQIKFSQKIGGQDFSFKFDPKEEQRLLDEQERLSKEQDALTEDSLTDSQKAVQEFIDSLSSTVDVMREGGVASNFLGETLASITKRFKKAGESVEGLNEGGSGVRDSRANPFSSASIFGNIGGAVGGFLGGPTGSVIGKVVGELSVLVGALKLFSASLEETTEAANKFSSEAISAKAQADLRKITNQIEIAREQGGDVASFTTAKSAFETSLNSFQAELFEFAAPFMEVVIYVGEAVLRLLGDIFKVVNFLSDVIEYIVEFASNILSKYVGDIPFIGQVFRRFDAWMRSNNGDKDKSNVFQDELDDVFGIERLSDIRRKRERDK